MVQKPKPLDTSELTAQDSQSVPHDSRIVRKSNREIGYRIKSGRLSLVSRKIFNVLLYYAQSMRDKEDEDGRWSIPISSLIRDTRFNSHNYDFLRLCLDELQTTQVARESEGGVTSEALIPSFTIDNLEHPGNESQAAGIRKRGGSLWVWFMLPPKLKQQLLAPDEYTRLPLEYMAALRTVAGLALYEICRRYITNPSKVTFRDTWQNWYLLLSGEPLGSAIPDYKYVNRRVLKKAITEVNEVTDIEVELIEFRVGRFVKELQFVVKLKAQSDLGLSPPPVDAGVLSKLTALGVTLVDAERLSAKYSDKELASTIALVERRAADKNLPSLGSPAAYMKKALRDGYASGQALRQETEAKVAAEQQEKAAKLSAAQQTAAAEREAKATVSMEDALERFDALPSEERIAEEKRFRQSNPAFARADSSGLVWRKALGSWLARANVES
ncbi:MAG: RepB family plasmid replication initiator protein [Proteobacteria bacterium]|nr:RepB family plasmid replication initiator protein [Pseudomonadota bacterium]